MRPSLAAGDDRRQILARQVLHADEVVAVDLAELVRRDDVRVLEPRRDPRLVQEHLAQLLAVSEVRLNALERDDLHEALDPASLGDVEAPHSALARAGRATGSGRMLLRREQTPWSESAVCRRSITRRLSRHNAPVGLDQTTVAFCSSALAQDRCRNRRNEQIDVRINERFREIFRSRASRLVSANTDRIRTRTAAYASWDDGSSDRARSLKTTSVPSRNSVACFATLSTRIKQRTRIDAADREDNAGRRRCRARPWRAGNRTPRITAIPEIRERWFRNHGRHCGRARIRGFRRRCRARAAPSAGAFSTPCRSQGRAGSFVSGSPAMTRKRCVSRRRACATIIDNSDLHALAACANEQLGLYDEAANHWAAILAADPDHSYANRRLAALLERAGDAAGAIDCLRRVVGCHERSGSRRDHRASASRCPRTGNTRRRSACSRTWRRATPDLGAAARRPRERPAGRRSHRGRDHPLLRGRCASTRNRRRRTAASDSPIRGSSAGTRPPRHFERPSSWRPIRPSAPTISGSRCPRWANADDARARCCARRRSSPTMPDSRGAAGAARLGRRRRRRASRAGRARAALRRRHPDIRAARGAGVPAPAEQDGLAGGLLPARRRDRPAGAWSGHQRVRARRQPPGRGADRARDHHAPPRRWRTPSRGNGWTTARAPKRSARCCCASTPPTARR